MAYVCSEIVSGSCAVWTEITLPAQSVLTSEEGAQAFAAGFGIIFAGWVVGYAVAQVKTLIKML